MIHESGSISNLADRKELWGTVQNERFLWEEGSRDREVILGGKQTGYFPYRAWQGFIRHITYLMLIRLAGLRFHFWERGNCNRVKSGFGDIGLSISNSILGLLPCF